MTELKFWNTLTRVKEEFTPIDPDNVRMYVCGPTVYDFAHIGNARPAIVFDVLFRLLRHVYGEEHVTYVRNLTDVDDKINARALRDYPDLPLNEAIAKVTEKTADRYHKDVAALGCLPPTHEPRATAHIDGMAKMIQTLIDKGNAYVTSGREGREVLFSVSSMPDYGKLSNRKLEDQQAGARIAVEDHKRNPGDFVLWKESASDEPGWDASFTEAGESVTIHGRPGWHIECSVMADQLLWQAPSQAGKLSQEAMAEPHKFDIHGGGLDLIFPHHENEIAQSCCAHGNDRMANLWMHNGFLQVEGKKMSKSDGNFVTIAELLETDKFGGRKWPGEVLRLAMLMTHYREPIDFSVKRLEEAASKLYDLNSACHGAAVQDLPRSIVECLANDLNFSQVLVALSELRSEIASSVHGKTPEEKAGELRSALEFLGLYYSGPSSDLFGYVVKDYPTDAEISVLSGQRLELIAAKNWPEADKIRDELLEQGIQLKDGKDPETGERVTTWEVKR
ncbi:cysteine--tRNA ligase [Hoeflea ulvae]|uniref:Cysteine--tRNA ligase n=1 Tax=Hoeflea ulvae TaxID=2983764 RepID=A0ABT3YJ09_9HYPH|nr:cysteine--tRNA ligase [Hoeflea ulvae]MCY0095774.1 cysteine--tRNA ligase [Hoeflea ulvae]